MVVVVSTSCKKFLDVNTDPDNPNNQSVLIHTLPVLPIIVLLYRRVFIILPVVQGIRLAPHGNALPAMLQPPINHGS